MKNTLQDLYSVISTVEKKPEHITISYSQFTTYMQCPNHWKLVYVDGKRKYSPSIHTCFGTSFHETLQHYLKVLYLKSVKEADAIDLNEYLMTRMRENYKSDVEKSSNGHFSTAKEIGEFYEEGCAILDWFKKRRTNYFKTRDFELVGVELPLYTPISAKHNHLIINGFLDLVIRDVKENRLMIWDIKTSMRGWNENKKKDKLTTSQLVLYKEFLAEQYNHDVDKIDISYFIVKRQIFEDAMFPIPRIQTFSPASGKLTRKNLRKDLDSFIDKVFLSDGTYNVNGDYPAVTGEKNEHCKYCEFKKDEIHCPKSKRQKLHEQQVVGSRTSKKAKV